MSYRREWVNSTGKFLNRALTDDTKNAEETTREMEIKDKKKIVVKTELTVKKL